MRPSSPRTRIVVPALLLLCGCGIPVVGLAPASPRLDSRVFSQLLDYPPIDSLTPTLIWQPLDAGILDSTGQISDVTYELRVWSTTSGYDGDLVYARDGLTLPFHQLEQPLQPEKKHLWSVRAHFTLDGQQWVTQWGMAGYLLREQTVPNAASFRFATPPR